MIKIAAEALHRLMYNALLFDTKSAKAFSAYNGTLKMNTSDGQVYLEDVAEVKSSDPVHPLRQWIMAADQVKQLESDLRKAEGEMTLTFGKALTVACLHPYFQGVYDVSLGEYAQQSALFDEEGHENGSLTFTINPDRLRKLALIQPRDYPVEMRIRMVEGVKTDVLLFAKGPTVRGAYATLDVVE